MKINDVLSQKKTTKSIYGKFKCKYDSLGSKDNEPSEIVLADIKLQ
jgi:hypothetical protein